MDAEKIKMVIVEGINSGRLPELPTKMHLNKGIPNEDFMADLGMDNPKPYSPWNKDCILRTYRKIKWNYRKGQLKQLIVTLGNKIIQVFSTE